MSVPRKPDSGAIHAHIAKLKAELWLGQARSWWPDVLFRTDPIETAAKILNEGEFLSRSASSAAGRLIHDAASPDVIAHTNERWKDYVRLYFRPKSPTQYSNEGFRPAAQYALGSCCPIPIVFVLDATDILTRRGVLFSNGNLAAAQSNTGDSAQFLASIPFKLVYHNTPFLPEERAKILFHRHAEVVVPGSLDLGAIKFIGCRTQAEYETLLQLLTDEARSRWAKRIGPGTRADLHYRKWLFVEQAALSPTEIVLRLNPTTTARGPYEVRALITGVNGIKLSWGDAAYTFGTQLRLTFGQHNLTDGYVVKLFLDGRIAYLNRYFGPDIPF